jgi:hypothetical protein
LPSLQSHPIGMVRELQFEGLFARDDPLSSRNRAE